MSQNLNLESSEPNKMIPHPVYPETFIVYCNRFRVAEKDEIYRKREQYIQVVGLYAKATDNSYVEAVCFEQITHADPETEDVVRGLNNTVIPTESLAEFMTLIQLAYARCEEVRAGLQIEGEND